MDFNRFATNYSDKVAEAVRLPACGEDFFLAAKATELQKLLRAHFGNVSDLTILDVGCGIGLLERHLAHTVNLIVGVDIALEAVRQAQQSVPRASFAGFATWLDLTPADPDVFAIPDPGSLIQLPWKPEIGWLAADLWMSGQPLAQAPRNVLRRSIDRAAERGYELRTGVECEFFLRRGDFRIKGQQQVTHKMRGKHDGSVRGIDVRMRQHLAQNIIGVLTWRNKA